MFLHEIIFMRILLDFYVNIEEVHKLFDYYKKKSYLKIFKEFKRFHKFFIYIAILLTFNIISINT